MQLIIAWTILISLAAVIIACLVVTVIENRHNWKFWLEDMAIVVICMLFILILSWAIYTVIPKS